MFYWNTRTQKSMTEAMVKLQGLPLDNKTLATVGIYPVEYPYPEHDSDMQGIIPTGDPYPKPGDPATYVQDFEVVSLPEDRIADNLVQLAESKRQAALQSADDAVSAYMSLFSDIEKTTWNTQEAEVTAWLADPTTPTPTLDMLAEARGIDRQTMLEKAAAKVTIFKQLAPVVIGRQQSYEDAIAATAADDSKTVLERITALREMQFDYSDIVQAVAGV